MKSIKIKPFWPQFQAKSFLPLTISACPRKWRLWLPLFALALAGLTTSHAFAAFPATISLAGANGSNGFQLTDSSITGALGEISVSNAGDINADGIDDVIAGAPGLDGSYVIVIFGAAGVGSGGNFDLNTLNGSNGFKIPGVVFQGGLGGSVSRAGDVNGDGVDDLIIGAMHAGPKIASRGRGGASYVIFGQQGIGASGSFDLDLLDGSNGFKIIGATVNDELGSSVSHAGDVNNDGFDDIIIGAPGGNGASYVIFGGMTVGSTGELNVSTLDGTKGFKIAGIDIGGRLGSSVSFAGDVNGDGRADLIIGAPKAGGLSGCYSCAGVGYVIFGVTGIGNGGNFDMTTLDGNKGFKVSGASSGNVGASVSEAGDVNHDGIDDLIIGEPGFSTSYVIFGKDTTQVNFPANLSLGDLGAAGLKISGGGSSVSTAGDINGDGVNDLIIGASAASYVVFGRNTTQIGANFPQSFDLAGLSGSNGFKILGGGALVSDAGDVNDDGVADLLVGSFVVFGRASVDTLPPAVQNDLYLFNPPEGPAARLSIAAPGLLNNDRDPDGGWLSAVLDRPLRATVGTLTFETDGSFIFLPSAGFSEGNFTYHVNDGANSSSSAQVRLRTNSAPIARPENCRYERATNRLRGAACRLVSQDPLMLQINVIANDSDPNSRDNVPSDGIGMTVDPSSVLSATVRGAGSTTDNGDGTVTVTLDPGFRGEYRFSYTDTDDLGLPSVPVRNVVEVE